MEKFPSEEMYTGEETAELLAMMLQNVSLGYVEPDEIDENRSLLRRLSSEQPVLVVKASSPGERPRAWPINLDHAYFVWSIEGSSFIAWTVDNEQMLLINPGSIVVDVIPVVAERSNG